MKVILQFALLCLSLYQAGGTRTCSAAPYKNDCLKKALEESTKSSLAFGKLLCLYYKAEKSGHNLDAYKDAATNFVKTLKCLRCDASAIFGNGRKYEDIFKEIAEDRKGVGESVLRLVDSLGLGTKAEKALCAMTLEPNIVTNLEDFFCKAQKEKAGEAAQQFAGYMGNFGAGIDKHLKIGNTMESLLQNLADAILPLNKEILILTQKMVGDLVCTVLGQHDTEC